MNNKYKVGDRVLGFWSTHNEKLNKPGVIVEAYNEEEKTNWLKKWAGSEIEEVKATRYWGKENLYVVYHNCELVWVYPESKLVKQNECFDE